MQSSAGPRAVQRLWLYFCESRGANVGVTKMRQRASQFGQHGGPEHHSRRLATRACLLLPLI